jgi:hypothetical protein
MQKTGSTARRSDPEAVHWMLKSKGVSKGNIKLLLDSTANLKVAWDRDDRGIKGFPMNTAFLLDQTEARLKGLRPRKLRKVVPPRVPTRLGDILRENTVQQVHEYLHEEPFHKALAELHSDEGMQALDRIKDTIGNALYVEQHGYQALPRPRGNWLHRQLWKMFRAAAPEKITDSQMARLFEHFCPCGVEHNREAMKKFRWRNARLEK